MPILNVSQMSGNPEHSFSTGNPGSLCVPYREHMRRSLGLEICKKMEIKIDETYHVVSCCCL